MGIRPSQQPQRAGESEKASVRGDHLRSVAELRVRASTQAATAKRSRGFSWNFFTWCGVLGILAACWRSWSSGSVLSAVVGLMRLRSLSRRGSVRAKRGKLARFAVRGAILAVALSVAKLFSSLHVCCFGSLGFPCFVISHPNKKSILLQEVLHNSGSDRSGLGITPGRPLEATGCPGHVDIRCAWCSALGTK